MAFQVRLLSSDLKTKNYLAKTDIQARTPSREYKWIKWHVGMIMSNPYFKPLHGFHRLGLELRTQDSPEHPLLTVSRTTLSCSQTELSQPFSSFAYTVPSAWHGCLCILFCQIVLHLQVRTQESFRESHLQFLQFYLDTSPLCSHGFVCIFYTLYLSLVSDFLRYPYSVLQSITILLIFDPVTYHRAFFHRIYSINPVFLVLYKNE